MTRPQPTYPPEYRGHSLALARTGDEAISLPRGYGWHNFRATAHIGHGEETFNAAVDKLFSGRVHRAAHITLHGNIEKGGTVTVKLGPIQGDCQIIDIIRTSTEAGFCYGTLPGHPERGEEAFLITFNPISGEVTGSVAAFSQEEWWPVRIARPLSRLIQHWATQRYAKGLRV